jgi:hypothetical protein
MNCFVDSDAVQMPNPRSRKRRGLGICRGFGTLYQKIDALR